ncbi:hypothetical protein ACWD5R_20370 [Streptomyces sp. NPDC002514]|uniref:hypothetical protein n=1 Tax=Streptomyces sp. NPDC001270 TaxID=3364554 RepID=UPI0036C8F2ED
MTEIIAAFVGGVFALGAAVITVRWTRSRTAGDSTPDPSLGNQQSDDVNSNAPRPSNNTQPGAAVPGSSSIGQFIGTNNGSVSQTNYHNGKQ